jgi:PAS domain S-box-containing protein
MQSSRFCQLVDLGRLQSLLDQFHETTGVGAGICSLDAEVIVCANWQPICTRFHRANAQSLEACKASHQRTLEKLQTQRYCEIACDNGLRFAAAGIEVDGKLDAYVVLGQYLYADDHVEDAFFLAQAGRFGYETEAYFEALRSVPRRSREQIRQITGYLVTFCELLADTASLHARQEEGARNLQSAQNELQGNIEFLKTLIDTIPSPIFYKDKDGRYQGCNHEFAEKVLGIDRSRILGKSLFEIPEIIPPSLARIYQEQDDQLLHRGGTQVYEAPVRCADGVLRYFEFHKSVYRNEGGQVEGIVGVMLDVTQRVRFTEALAEAKEAAENANRSKSQFLANISHEFRTPMNGVLGMTELVLETDLTDPQRRQLNAVQQSARSLMMVLDDILDFSRVDAGKARLEVAQFLLQDCVVYAARMLAPQAAEKGLELTCRFEPGLPRKVLGDAGRLRQILLNLVGNAVKFTETGRISVHVETEERGLETFLHFAVSDTGVGVAAERQEEVFETFHKASDDQESGLGGTGLGLAICTKLVDLMHGRMWLESRKGQGSTFHFTIKVGVLDQEDQQENQAPWDQPRRILLVSPNQETSLAVGEAFASVAGCEFCPVASTRDAQATLGRETQQGRCFDLVVLDDDLDAQDVQTLVNQLKQNPTLGFPPALFLARTGRGGKMRKEIEGIRVAETAKPILGRELLEAASGLLLPEVQTSKDSEQAAWQQDRSMRILVAEDNPVNQLLARELLTRWGHSVTVVPNGVKALMAMESEGFDVVLMDIQMPEMDGLDATRAIRQREEVVGGHTPIVAMTAYVLEADRQRCLDAGMDDYVSKPIDRTELRDALRRASRAGQADSLAQASSDQADVLADCLPEAVFADNDADSCEQEPMDLQQVINEKGGDSELVRELAELFVDECPRMLQAIQEALRDGDVDELARSAHFMRGSLENFTRGSASSALQAIEASCQQEDLSKAREAFDHLEEHLGQITPALRMFARQRC